MYAGATRARFDCQVAADLATGILGSDSERIRHTAAVAARAEALAAGLDVDAISILVAAAWLHDVGYADTLKVLGFHPVDGAWHLRDLDCPDILCGLVAHHSGSRFVAAARGLSRYLAPFRYVENPISDTLTVADQTAGPHGRPMTIDERMTDTLQRHGPDSPNARAHPAREPYIRAAAARVIARLEAHGVDAGRHHITDAAVA